MTDKPEPIKHQKLFEASLGFAGELSATDQLRKISDAYAEVSEASNSRIRQLMSAQAQAAIAEAGSTATVVRPGTATGTGAALEGVVKAESTISGELTTERENLIEASIQTLIATVQVGQAQSAKAAEQSAKAATNLNSLTEELVTWTRDIGRRTRWIERANIIAAVVAVPALAVAIVALAVAILAATHGATAKP